MIRCASNSPTIENQKGTARTKKQGTRKRLDSERIKRERWQWRSRKSAEEKSKRKMEEGSQY